MNQCFPNDCCVVISQIDRDAVKGQDRPMDWYMQCIPKYKMLIDIVSESICY